MACLSRARARENVAFDRACQVTCSACDEVNLFVPSSYSYSRCRHRHRSMLGFLPFFCSPLFTGCFALLLTLLLTFVALSCRCQSQAVVYFSSRLMGPDETVAALLYGPGSSDLAYTLLVVEGKARIVIKAVWHISAATIAGVYAGNSRVTTTRLSKSSVVKQPPGLLMPQLQAKGSSLHSPSTYVITSPSLGRLSMR